MPFPKGHTPWNKGMKIPGTPIEERLLSKRKILSNGCWEFTGSKDSGGYGHIRFMNKIRKVHRVSAFLYKEFDIENPIKVLHKCDHVYCFNPNHLFYGTQADNIKDMDKKGRRDIKHSIGQNNGRAKLTNKQIKEIFELRKQRWSYQQLMQKYSVAEVTIWRILSKNNWSHLKFNKLPHIRVSR